MSVLPLSKSLGKMLPCDCGGVLVNRIEIIPAATIDNASGYMEGLKFWECLICGKEVCLEDAAKLEDKYNERNKSK